MSAVYQPISISKKNFARTFGARISNMYIFQAMLFINYNFSRKTWDSGEVSICKSYFIYTLFRGKSYFIWRKIILYLEI